MKIVVSTNLDVRNEEWTVYADHVPQIGSRLVSTGMTLRAKVELHLAVVGVTYHHDRVEVELGLTGQWESVAHFNKWYEEHRWS